MMYVNDPLGAVLHLGRSQTGARRLFPRRTASGDARPGEHDVFAAWGRPGYRAGTGA
jgi:hypothetical protein